MASNLKLPLLLFAFFLMQGRAFTQVYPYGKHPFITQMHIHGWSHHNGADKPGSVQYHNKQADSVNVDVLWWTEHHNIFTPFTLPLSLSGATIDTVTLDLISTPGTSAGLYHGWKCLDKEGVSQATLNSDTLELSITANAINGDWQSLTYAPRSLLGLIKDNAYVKPLASLPALNFMLHPVAFDADDSRIKFTFKLSWHYRQHQGQDIVIFELSPSFTDTVLTTNNIDTVFVQLPLTPGSQTVSLHIAEAAALLDHGIDNNLSDIELSLMARQSATTTAWFNNFTLVPHETDADTIVQKEREILDYYTNISKSHNLLGVEYSRSQHLNAFVPKYINNKDIFTGRNFGDVVNWVDMVHQNGGLVSYNHMFGTNWTTGSDQLQDYRADTLAQFLFANNAYGADILEVGYTRRGGSDLRRHLKVWDKLTAKGMFVYGNGVSDSHGDEWMENSNIFHTWIYARDSSDTELLSALSRGKMCFGVYNDFQGDLWYTAGNLELGDRGFSNERFAQLKVFLAGAPPGAVVKLTQALLNDSSDIEYLYDELPVDIFSLPLLDFGKPCFIRLGVYDANDKPLIFGQPIIVMGVINDTILYETPDKNALTVFPNPVYDKLYLEFNVAQYGNYKIRLLDATSRQVVVLEDKSFYLGKYGFSYSCSGLSAGIYFVEITGEDDNIIEKLIVR